MHSDLLACLRQVGSITTGLRALSLCMTKHVYMWCPQMPQQSSGRSRNAGMVVVTWEQQQGQPPRPRASSVAAARGELTPQGALSYLQPDALCYLSLMWRAERKVGEALCGMVRSYVPMTELDRSRWGAAALVCWCAGVLVCWCADVWFLRGTCVRCCDSGLQCS